MGEIHKKPIILFDGICKLCNASVQFIIKHDKKKCFLFASLQSDAAVKLLLQDNIKKIDLESIVLIDDNRIYRKSTAVLRIVRKLDGLWPILFVFIIIPKSIRDMIYEFIAKHRYQWFGTMKTCSWEPKENKNRFI